MNYNNGQMPPMNPMNQQMQQMQRMQQMGQQMQMPPQMPQMPQMPPQMPPQMNANQGGAMPNTRPMEPMAQQMAQQGRYGDSMLVHMNPVEVAGIASLSPTGGLTTNPMTGQPEAFLPFLLPLLGSLGGSALAGTGFASALGLGSLGATAMGAIGSGLATTAVTGDIKKGLTAGLTGFGIGSALNAASAAVSPGLDAAQTAVTEGASAAKDLATAATEQSTLVKGLGDAATAADKQTLLNLQGGLAEATTGSGRASLLQQGPPTASGAINPGSLEMAQNTLAAETSKASQNVFGNFKDNPGAFTKEFGKNLMKPSSLLPIGVGEGQRAAMEAQEARDAEFGATEAERAERLARSQGILDQSLGQVATDYGYDYGRGYQAGGITSINPMDYQQRMADFQQMGMQQPVRMFGGGEAGRPNFSPNFNSNNAVGANSFGGSDRSFAFNPSGRQASLRGPRVVSSEELEGYRPGIDPEINYFRKKLPAEPAIAEQQAVVNDPVNVAGRAAEIERLRNDPTMNFVVDESLSTEQKDEIFAVRQKIAQNAALRERGFDAPEGYSAVDAEGNPTVRNSGLTLDMSGQDLYSGIGGFNRAPYGTEYGMNNGGVVGMNQGDQVPNGEQAAQALIQQTAMALLGRMSEEESSVVIKRFVDEFGTEAFQQLRNQVLESVVPNSQKEGLIQGAGGGMDDQIGGMIGDQQKVAVSPGEFIVPGDVVSGLGDGDTSAGAKELASMMDRVRTERTGTTEQPAPLVNVRGGGLLPA